MREIALNKGAVKDHVAFSGREAGWKRKVCNDKDHISKTQPEQLWDRPPGVWVLADRLTSASVLRNAEITSSREQNTKQICTMSLRG